MIFGMDYRETVETFAGAQTTPMQFDRMMPKIAVALFTFIMTGTAANNGIGGTGIDRYQLSLDNEQVIDMTPSETRALFEYIYSRMGGSVPAANDLTWVWPFYLLALLAPKLDMGNYPEVGLPDGSDKVWRVQLNANIAAGNNTLGYKKSPNPVTHSPYLVGRVISGLTASTADQDYEINWPQLPTAGIIVNGYSHFSRLKVIAADKAGAQIELCDVLNDQVLSVLQPYSAQSITDPLFIPFDVPTIFPKGSILRWNTNGSYVGTERVVPVQFAPEKDAKKAA